VPWFWWLDSGFLLRRIGFNPGRLQKKFVVEEVASWSNFSPISSGLPASRHPTVAPNSLSHITDVIYSIP
jgi:hypothetical protein